MGIDVRPSFNEFKRLAGRGNTIPLYAEIDPALTPCAAYGRIRGGDYSFLLESGRIDQKIGRYSYCGADPSLVLRSNGRRVEIESGRGVNVFEGDPVERLRSLFDGARWVAPEEPEAAAAMAGYSGGAVGLISYDARLLFEELPDSNPDDIGTPDFLFVMNDAFTVFDHAAGRTLAVATAHTDGGGNLQAAYDTAAAALHRLASRLADAKASRSYEKYRGLLSDVRSNCSQGEYENMARRAKEYIAAGDIYQANLSQRLSVETDAPPYELYKILLEINPSPFGGILEFNGFNVVGSSPERLVLVDGDRVETRPIAGTRRRGKDFKEDRSLSAELILNEKERAEHIMLVDLERNDIGRVCGFGSVHVDELMVVEKYSHVIHIVSNVAGRLNGGRDRFDVIRAVFPGGTITGVPKVRCMEIIDELENVRRGLYTGSIGYVSYNGVMDLNIVIRTFVMKDGLAHVQVGAGIVADSDPEFEYHETMHKAQAALSALDRLKAQGARLNAQG